MKPIGWAALAVLTCSPAWAGTSCDQVKSAIEAKIRGHGVKQYTLEVVAPDQTGERKVIGSCDGGKQRVVYARTTSAPASKAAPKTEAPK
jgi:hypothetical protein